MELNEIKESIFAMHTRLDIHMHGSDYEVELQSISKIKELLSSDEMMLSCHNPEALAAKLNHYSSTDTLQIPDEFYTVLEYSRMYYYKSMELFDVTLGSGHFVFEEALKNFPSNIIQHTNSPFHLDFGGFGKGYSLKKIRKMLLDSGIRNVFLSFGGTSILCLGTNNAKVAWHYTLPQYPHISFQLSDESISVSSNTNSQGDPNHIIYPDTYKPADMNLVVAAKCKDALDAEVLSTSLILAKMKNFQQLMDAFPKSEAYIIDKVEPQNFLYLKSKS